MSQSGTYGNGGGGGGGVLTLTGDVGSAIDPSGGNINLQGNQIGHLGAISFDGTGPGQMYATALVDGTTIVINGSGQLAATGSFAYNDENSDFTAVSNNGYFVSGAIDCLLPASPNQGDAVIVIVAVGPVGTITGNTGQVISVGNAATSPAGTITPTLQGNSITLRYQAASTTWFAESFIGNWTV